MGLIGTGVKKLTGRERPVSKKTTFLGRKNYLWMLMIVEISDWGISKGTGVLAMLLGVKTFNQKLCWV